MLFEQCNWSKPHYPKSEFIALTFLVYSVSQSAVLGITTSHEGKMLTEFQLKFRFS